MAGQKNMTRRKDPANKPRAAFDPREYSPEELEQIETVLRLLMEPRRLVDQENQRGE